MSFTPGDLFLRGHPHENALLRKNTPIASFWLTVHTDPENAVPKKNFFETRSKGGGIRKRNPTVFMCTANPHTFRNSNGGLHARVHAV